MTDLIPIGDAPPGRLRIKNTYKHRTFHCQWHPLDKDRIDGKVTVRPLSSEVIRVAEADVQIDCESSNSGFSFAFGSGSAGAATMLRTYSAKVSGGGQAQTRLRSP